MKFILFFVGLLSTVNFVKAQLDAPIIQNFTNKIYGKNSNPEIYCITQNIDDIIFAGTSNGVIAYDGQNWTFIGVQKGTYVTSITCSNNGKIYVGALGEFGELIKRKNGSYYFQSYAEKITLTSPVWRTFVVKDKVYFQCENAIYYFQNGKKLGEIKPKTSFHLSFLVDDELYVRQRNKGLYKIQGANLKLINADKTTREEGLFALFKKNQKLHYFFRNDFSQNLIESSIYGGIPLNDGNYAINTLKDGVFILNAQFEPIYNYSTKNGLKDNDVKAIHQGSDGNLWLATNNGISYIEYKSDVSFWGENQGLIGDVQDVFKKKNSLYFATSKGLFYKKENTIEQLDLNFPCWSFFTFENKLFVCSSSGIFEVIADKTKLKVLGNFNTLSFFYEHFIAAGPNGIHFFNKQFNPIKKVDFLLNRTLNAKVDHKNKVLWIGSIKSGLLKINKDFEITLYDDFDGLDIAWVNPVIDINNNIVFATKSGLQNFVNEEIVKKSLPDSLKSNPDFYRGFFEPIGRSKEVFNFFNFKNQTYIIENNEIKRFQNGKTFRSNYAYFNFGRINQLQKFNDDIYLCTSDGVIKLEHKNDCYKNALKLQFTSVNAGNDKFNFTTSFDLPYENNNIDIRYVAPNFLANTTVKYRYFIEGKSTKWSDFNHENKLILNNLYEGNYTIKIQAKNSFDQYSSEIRLNFIVLAPWYRTIYAYIVYFFLLILVFYFTIKLSKRRLQKRNEELEEIVEERTKEIKLQKEEIEEKHKEITDSINYAERIQTALMSNDEHWKHFCTDYFILFKPRDVVSGDFYWTYQNDDYAVWTVADCTGHGVPGAFMSMLGIGFLNEIVIEGKCSSPDVILNLLREKIIKALEQKNPSEERKDGMDISLCVFDKKTQVLSFAGANNPMLLLTQNKEKALALNDKKMLESETAFLVSLAADKMPVGKYVGEMQSFAKSELKIDKGDIIYLLSDGFQDQFGGKDGKKFMIKRLKELLLINTNLTLDEQKDALEITFKNWITEGQTEQIDDVCLVGVKLLE